MTLLVEGLHEHVCFVIHDSCMSFHGFRTKCQTGESTMLSPCIPIRRTSDSAPFENNLTFHKVPLSAGKYCSIGHKKVFGNVRIRNDHEELAAHPNGEEAPIPLRPSVESSFGVFAKEGISYRRTRRNPVTLLVSNEVAKYNGAQEVS